MINIKERIKELVNDFELLDFFTDYSSGTVESIIQNGCECNVDVYDHDLWEWAKNNEYAVNDYVQSFGISSTDFNIGDVFRSAQYFFYIEKCYAHLSNIIEYLILTNLDTEFISQNLYNKILEVANTEDTNLRIENVIENLKKGRD